MIDESAPTGRRPSIKNRWRWFIPAWTVFALIAILLLWILGRDAFKEQVFLLNERDPTWKAWWDAARRNLVLAHLSLYRSYAWILLGPYVLWAASRFCLEREKLWRHLVVQVTLAGAFVGGCQLLGQHLIAGRPVRLVVAVTETASNDLGADGDPAEIIRHFRQEFRFGAASNALPPPPDSVGFFRLDRNRSTNPVVGAAHHHEENVEWQSVFDDGPAPEAMFKNYLPFPGPGRNPLPSLALDLFVFVSLAGLGHALHFRNRFQERERRAVALESSLASARLHVLQAQLQPHFLFNTLNSITALVRQNPAAAEEMLTSLSDLLRLALNQADKPVSSLREELRMLRLYVDIQQMRFGGRLKYEQSIDPNVLDCEVPNLLLQPLVENAIHHGIDPSGANGIVRVTGGSRGGDVELAVEDNGPGSPDLAGGTARLGVGLTNVRDRLVAMFGQQARMTFRESPDGGLAVHLGLPYRPTKETSGPQPT